jgi:hypothetical protein
MSQTQEKLNQLQESFAQCCLNSNLLTDEKVQVQDLVLTFIKTLEKNASSIEKHVDKKQTLQRLFALVEATKQNSHSHGSSNKDGQKLASRKNSSRRRSSVTTPKSAQSTKTPELPQCTICLDDIDKKEQPIASLNCSHDFHLTCIGSYFNSAGTFKTQHHNCSVS